MLLSMNCRSNMQCMVTRVIAYWVEIWVAGFLRRRKRAQQQANNEEEDTSNFSNPQVELMALINMIMTTKEPYATKAFFAISAASLFILVSSCTWYGTCA